VLVTEEDNGHLKVNMNTKVDLSLCCALLMYLGHRQRFTRQRGTDEEKYVQCWFLPEPRSPKSTIRYASTQSV